MLKNKTKVTYKGHTLCMSLFLYLHLKTSLIYCSIKKREF